MILAPDQLGIEAYHKSAPSWLSKTSLMDFKRMGAPWWKMAYLDLSIQRPRPSGAEQGQALDCYLTEGADVFGERYSVKPDGMSFTTKEGKEWRAAHDGKMLISQDDRLILSDAVAAVRTLPCWPEIEKAQAQMTVRRMSAGLGLGLQSRPDWLDRERGIVWDLKKTRDLDVFGRQAIDIGYHLQAAIASWCLAGDGIGVEHAYLVAVEWERGARARVYEIPGEVLQYADREMRAIAAEIADRIKRQHWNDRQLAPEGLPIPGWLLAKMEAA